MKTFRAGDTEVTIPSIGATLVDGNVRLRIEEGDHAGIEFEISNARMDEEDDSLLWYDLNTFPDGQVDLIKPIVDNFLLSILINQIEKDSNENPTTE